MKNNDEKPSFQLLILITSSKLAEKAAEIFQRGALPLQYRFCARGTATSEIIDMLGLGDTNKSVLISMIPKNLSTILIKKLLEELKLDSVNSGIVFTIPMTGANNLILHILTHNDKDNNFNTNGKEGGVMEQTKYSLIAAIVNEGFSGDVMQTARAVGARGGTVIHSRRIVNEEVTSFWGLSVGDEKEIVLILSESENKVPIMKRIGENCGMHSDAKGIVMSLPIDEVAGI